MEDSSDAFIDDVIIFSGTFPEHIEHLRTVLESFRKAKITVKPSETLLGYKEIEFLAHTLGNGKVQPTEDKIDVINRISPHTTKKQVRSFMGTINFYRRFISHFADIAAPLTDLTAKGRPNKARSLSEHQDSFDKLKMAIHVTQYTVLRSPEFTKMFYLQTDASNRGIGAVLMQEENNLRLPVMYISNKLNSAEDAYSTIEKDCLAIVKSI